MMPERRPNLYFSLFFLGAYRLFLLRKYTNEGLPRLLENVRTGEAKSCDQYSYVPTDKHEKPILKKDVAALVKIAG